MKAILIALWVTFTLSAADERQLALALKAQSDFDRVQLSARPPLADAETCQQSEAAALAWSLPEDQSTLHFRKGWCALAAAVATANQNEFANAAAEFEQGVAAWPARSRRNPKKVAPEPLNSGLRVLVAIARLQTGVEFGPGLAEALNSPNCASNVMTAEFCGRMLDTGRLWMGWIALRDGRLEEAARLVAASPDSGWSQWVQGRRSFDVGSYSEAAANYAKAIDIWKAEWPQPTLVRALGPRPTVSVALADLGGAQLLAGDLANAIRTLDSAIKADGSQARAFFLRARAKELVGQGDAALGDYNLAARTAFAGAKDLASGEAHLYRGILMYRRKDFAHAEDEFATALNFEIAPPLRADASAWRHLAAVADGGCGSARESLEDSMSRVSPFFPKSEARSLASACVLNSRAL
jgi:tetratricopeptide (TPR) repeat protein